MALKIYHGKIEIVTHCGQCPCTSQSMEQVVCTLMPAYTSVPLKGIPDWCKLDDATDEHLEQDDVYFGGHKCTELQLYEIEFLKRRIRTDEVGEACNR